MPIMDDSLTLADSSHHEVAGLSSAASFHHSMGDVATTEVAGVQIVGQSPQLKEALANIHIQAQYDAPVLITGETGTGKELAARGLHYCGQRRGQPFVAVNCATLTTELFASELFGHKRGAFTDARHDKKGLLAEADQGTLFLDEIDSLSLASQAALLRFLQESEFRPVGSEKTLTSNARLIASANCDLLQRVDEGLFRRDLYYRLYILAVHMPPLRQRRQDIPLLVNHFLRQFAGQYGLAPKQVSQALMADLVSMPWHGNVRELENTLHRLFLLSPGQCIDSEHCSAAAPSTAAAESAQPAMRPPLPDLHTQSHYNFADDKRQAVEQFEKHYVVQMLELAEGNITRAAALCGKDRRAFGKLVKKYDVKKVIITTE
jgi:DNA-binding NtrC family response regulator